MATTYTCGDIDALSVEDRRTWSDLHSSLNASPQLGPGFASAVADVRGGVRVVIVRDEHGTVTGVWPLQRRRWRMTEPVGFPLADFQGPLQVPGSELDVFAALRVAGADTYDYDHLVDAASFERWASERWTSPAIDLGPSPEGAHQYFEDLARRGSSLPSRLAYCRRQLERALGPITAELSCLEHAALADLIAAKRYQYSRTGRRDPLGPPWRRTLLHRLLDREDS
ncbi:MAG: hypothetical protein ACRDVW_07620, partial [Acidimicrobiales bacterium]